MYRNQIHLDKRKLKNNIEFTKLIHKAELEDADKWFDYKGNNVVTREHDEGMDIEKYIELMKNGIYFCKLDIGSSHFDNLVHVVIVTNKCKHRFAWVDCPYTEENFMQFKKAFGKAYHQKLENIPVEPGLQEYHIQVATGYRKKL